MRFRPVTPKTSRSPKKRRTGVTDMSIDDETITTATQNNSYEIEKILNHRKYKKRTKYFVKWKDYDESENCWIWESEFDDDQIIKDYYENLEKL
ncbi:hypothetical protein INT48_004675 [Thamnidium elegans]|uniref:Chromo domain-containing protein n=1 Tax=Thamnidium elegans TaxID=101142 RepID=A0A8H7SI81_9FUNG|nr:hypothetical protein INT48_004675 [Thamnidium elegans]